MSRGREGGGGGADLLGSTDAVGARRVWVAVDGENSLTRGAVGQREGPVRVKVDIVTHEPDLALHTRGHRNGREQRSVLLATRLKEVVSEAEPR